jgi:hypothetical protein
MQEPAKDNLPLCARAAADRHTDPKLLIAYDQAKSRFDDLRRAAGVAQLAYVRFGGRVRSSGGHLSAPQRQALDGALEALCKAGDAIIDDLIEHARNRRLNLSGISRADGQRVPIGTSLLQLLPRVLGNFDDARYPLCDISFEDTDPLLILRDVRVCRAEDCSVDDDDAQRFPAPRGKVNRMANHVFDDHKSKLWPRGVVGAAEWIAARLDPRARPETVRKYISAKFPKPNRRQSKRKA